MIGLTGPAGAGKSTVANMLRDMHGYRIESFADPLRDMLYALNPIVVANGTRVRDLVNEVGWDHAKRWHPEVRRLMQRMGTEAGREVLGEDVWIEHMSKRLTSPGRFCEVVVPDVRFDNEARLIRDDHAGVVVHVSRDVPSIGNHASESGLSAGLVDYYINNHGSLDDLRATVGRLAGLPELTGRAGAV